MVAFLMQVLPVLKIVSILHRSFSIDTSAGITAQDIRLYSVRTIGRPVQIRLDTPFFFFFFASLLHTNIVCDREVFIPKSKRKFVTTT